MMARGKTLKAKIGPEHPFSEVIRDAYRVFRVPKPGITGVCTGCCMDAEIEDDFFGPEIEDLPLHYVQDWFFAAADPGKMPKAVWTYLLPRILEILAHGGEDPANVGVEVSLNRYPTGDRARWSDAEWDVLDRFRRQFLASSMTGELYYLDDVLCMFGLAGWPLDDLFRQVLEAPDPVLIGRFWQDWCIGRPSIWITAFWEAPGNTRAWEFYTSDALYDRMVRVGLDENADPALAKKARDVASVIETNRDA